MGGRKRENERRERREEGEKTAVKSVLAPLPYHTRNSVQNFVKIAQRTDKSYDRRIFILV